ncbi:MAG: TadE/TadG family type IV pilus assembly protein [Planctomycetaceae bacterium]
MRRRFSQSRPDRSGTTLVETAVVLPMFFIVLFGFIEFGHCFMTIHTMNSAARRAARAGIGETATSAQIIAEAHDILNQAINADLENVKIQVKDASVFDTANVNAATINYENLPDVEVSTLPSQALFIVRIQVPYSEVGILGPKWITALNLYGQSVMRKE